MGRNKFLSRALLFTLLSISAALWTSIAKGQQVGSLKAGYIPIAACLPLFAAIENGYFEQEGLKVEMNPMAGGAAIIPALVGGSLDVGFSAYFSVILARGGGINITIIAASNKEAEASQPTAVVVVREDSGIVKAKDLEGKTLAVNTVKGVDWVAIAEWISKNGADQKKVTWIELPFPTMGAALRNKQVDAITGLDPFLSVELEAGGMKIIAHHLSEVDPNLPLAGFVSTDAWLRKNRSLADRFVKAVSKGIDYINSRPEKRGEILVKYTGMKPELAARLKFYSAYDRFIDAKAFQKLLDLAAKYGMVSKRLDIKDIALPGILR